MKIDFNNLNIKKTNNNIISPKDVFMTLKREEKFQYLWDVQSEVLSKWDKIRNEKDIVIKMNTGAGKTLVALLILQSLSNENSGNSIYVVPDNYLKEQVEKSAKELGIKITTNKDSIEFIQKKHILLINSNELVNGKSAFGMRGKNNIPIENIVIDDAHNCLSTIKNQFSIKIEKEHALYTKIINIFKNSLMRYLLINENLLMEKLSEFYQEDIVVPFWMWNEKLIEVKETIEKYIKENNENNLIFNYPLIKDVFEMCHCVLSWNGIEIIPYCTPIDKIRSFTNAKHRIFLSATIPDLTIFNTVLNIDKDKIKSNLITPNKAYDIGERLIVFPQYINNSLHDVDICNKISEYALNYNVLIIVPSRSRAKFWKESLSENCPKQILDSTNIRECIRLIERGEFKGATILINKYDGIDLPGDMCRLIVIDKLPNISSLWDSFEQEVIPDSKRIVTEYVQKIEQGMGRGIRSNTDYCGVILMNPSLISTLYHNDSKTYFSEASQIQMSISESLWEKVQEEADIFQLLEYVFKRDDDWVDFSRQQLLDCEYKNIISFNELELICRKAYNCYLKSNISEAVSCFDDYINNTEMSPDERGYVKMLKAEYEHQLNPVKAQETLKSARADNYRVLMPECKVVYEKLTRKGTSQVNNILEYIKTHNMMDIIAVLDNLKFESGTSKKFEQSMMDLGKILGYNSQRPEKEFNDGGPDNLWLTDEKYFVIECKNETTTDFISKSDVEQLLSSNQWFKNKYPGQSYESIIVHNSTFADTKSNPDEDMRVISREELEKLVNNVSLMYRNIYESLPNQSVEEISSLLNHYGFGNDFLQKYTKKIKHKR